MQSARKTYAQRVSMKDREVNCESRVVFRKQFYKTELCRFYQSGCMKGSNCSFAHGQEDLQVAPDLTKTSLCQAWIARRCPLPAEECQFAHGWSDMHATDAFLEYGARQSKNTGSARGTWTGDAADENPGRTIPEAAPGSGRGGARRLTRRSTGSSVRLSEASTEDASPSASPSAGASSPGSDDTAMTEVTSQGDSPASQGASPASPAFQDDFPASTPTAEQQPSVPLAGPAFQVAFVMQPWALASEVPILPMQLTPMGLVQGLVQQGPAHQLPDNRTLEMLLKQAMPDHYDD